jgi:galactose mutarotase-like enzyme
VVRGWQDHDDVESDGGYEYVAITVTVDNTIARGSFDVDDSDLRLQDNAGFMWDRVGVDIPEEATLLPLDGDQQLPTGESVTFLVVFEVLAGQQLDHLFWSPSSDRILTLASVADI